MNFHPHIHTILLGGGLTPKNDWKDNGTEFFLPIRVISKVFRGKYMEEKYLSKLRGKEIPEILKQLYGINVYACKAYGGHLGKHLISVAPAPEILYNHE